ncbi:MAG: hypothetical protein VXY77_04160 [Pseudomonadota bacterium]|nr:hypothetical protein [Pseudomonadota bacterium]
MFYTKSSLFSLIVLGLLTGCGPITQTKIHYRPPKSAGKSFYQCINRCERQRFLDSSYCQGLQARCYQLSRFYDSSNYLWYYGYYKSPFYTFDLSTTDCNFETSQCMAKVLSRYNQCYQSCGGQVSKRTICISNCS